MSDPVGCDLYTITFEATFQIKVAAPSDMTKADVRALLEKHRAYIVKEEDIHYEWTIDGWSSPEEGDASETDRHTWIVNDQRDDFVQGEETAWLPEPVRDSASAEDDRG